ncbi:MAG: hypothetical protein ACOYB3_08570 [Azonexus sp.]
MDKPLQGAESRFAALQHDFNYKADSPNVKHFAALQQFNFWRSKSVAYDSPEDSLCE